MDRECQIAPSDVCHGNHVHDVPLKVRKNGHRRKQTMDRVKYSSNKRFFCSSSVHINDFLFARHVYLCVRCWNRKRSQTVQPAADGYALFIIYFQFCSKSSSTTAAVRCTRASSVSKRLNLVHRARNRNNSLVVAASACPAHSRPKSKLLARINNNAFEISNKMSPKYRVRVTNYLCTRSFGATSMQGVPTKMLKHSYGLGYTNDVCMMNI